MNDADTLETASGPYWTAAHHGRANTQSAILSSLARSSYGPSRTCLLYFALKDPAVHNLKNNHASFPCQSVL